MAELRKVGNGLLALQLRITHNSTTYRISFPNYLLYCFYFLQDHYCILCLGNKLVLFWIAQRISVLFSSVICGLTSSSLFHAFLANL